MGRGRRWKRQVRGLCLSIKHLPPQPNPLPLVSLYGERQAFAFRERERCRSLSRRNSSHRESMADESLFLRLGIPRRSRERLSFGPCRFAPGEHLRVRHHRVEVAGGGAIIAEAAGIDLIGAEAADNGGEHRVGRRKFAE